MHVYLESILEAEIGSVSVRVLSCGVEAAASGLVLWLLPGWRLKNNNKIKDQDMKAAGT